MLIRLLQRSLRPYARPLLVVVVLQLLGTAAVLYLPSLNADIIDEGVARADTGFILRTGAVMLGVSLLQVVCTVAAVWFGARTAMSVGRDLRGALFAHIGSFSAREVAGFGAPSLITRTTNDVQQVQMLVLTSCTMLVAAPIMMVGGVLMAVREDVGLSWLLAVSVPALCLAVGAIVRQMVPGFRRMQTRIDEVNRVLREQIAGVRVVRAFAREEHETARFDRANDELTSVALTVGRWMALMFPTVLLILNVSSVAVLWFGAQRVDQGLMEVGALTAFLAYLLQILMAVMMATFMLVLVPRASVCADRIVEVLDTASSVVPSPAPVRAFAEPVGLELRAVELTHPGASDPVLRDVSLVVRPGRTTAVVGSTGAGKTTLVNLVPRLFDVTGGAVLVGGVDVRDLDAAVLHGAIGLVPQRAFLFSGTVASNLRYGRADATDDEMWEALGIAQARDFVAALPQGLDAPITQGGTNLSGGQRQRLAIARAVVRRPAVYLFDDAFSALDLATDARLRAALRPVTRDAAVLVVAQRVASIVDADEIVVLEGGAVVGRGTHDELSASCATYQEIVASQRTVQGGRVTAVQGRRMQETERITAGPGPGRGPFGGGLVAQRSLDFGPSARRVAGRMRPERVRVAAVVVLCVVSVGLSVLGPTLLGRATDIVFAGLLSRRLPAGTTQEQAVEAARRAGDDDRASLLSRVDLVPGEGVDIAAVGRVLLLALVVYVASSLLAWLQAYLLNDAVQRTVCRLREEVAGKLHRLPLAYADQQPRGELLSRVTNDIDNLSQTLQQTLSQLLTSVLTVLGVVGMMLWISPLLALVALVTVPLTVLVSAQVMKRSQGLFVDQWRTTGRLNAHVEEAFTGHALTTVFGRRRQVEAVFDEENERLFSAGFGAQFVSGLILPVTTFLGNLGYVAIAVLGGVRVATGAMSLGEVQAFIQYSRQFSQPLTQVASMVNLLQSGVASAERVFEVLDAVEEPAEGTAALPAARARGEVVFEDVSFRYEPQTPLIEGLSLVARPGQTVAIVGPTGAGKTTLVNLVLRFYDLDAGRITLDGVDIATLRRRDLRSRIGMVLQDTWLFAGTIRDNIAYGRPDAPDEDVLAAARATFVDRFVHALPDGYDTVLDEEGSGLSAGERQLITIARAFLSDPALLILDEATSSVDTRTELLVQQAMSALRSDRTSFVIAHRLSTIRDADLILVLRDGRIVEQGTHDDLLARRGAYAELHDAHTVPAV